MDDQEGAVLPPLFSVTRVDLAITQSALPGGCELCGYCRLLRAGFVESAAERGAGQRSSGASEETRG